MDIVHNLAKVGVAGSNPVVRSQKGGHRISAGSSLGVMVPQNDFGHVASIEGALLAIFLICLWRSERRLRARDRDDANGCWDPVDH